MRLGRSMLGVLMGTLLGLATVALTVFGAGSAAAPTASTPAQPVSNATASNMTAIVAPTTTSAGPPVSFYYSDLGVSNLSGVPSQLSSIPKQPISITFFTLLPIVAAVVLGFAFYRLSKGRSQEELPDRKQPI